MLTTRKLVSGTRYGASKWEVDPRATGGIDCVARRLVFVLLVARPDDAAALNLRHHRDRVRLLRRLHRRQLAQHVAQCARRRRRGRRLGRGARGVGCSRARAAPDGTGS